MNLGLRDGVVVLYDEDTVKILTADLAGSIKLAEWWDTNPRSMVLDKSLNLGAKHGLPGFNYRQWSSEGSIEFKRLKRESDLTASLERAMSVRRMVNAAYRLKSVRSVGEMLEVHSNVVLSIIVEAERLAAAHGMEDE